MRRIRQDSCRSITSRAASQPWTRLPPRPARQGRAGRWAVAVLFLTLLGWHTGSFGADVNLDLVFPQDEIAETSTTGTQSQLLETTFESLIIPFLKPRIARPPAAGPEALAEAEQRREARRRPFEVSAMIEAGRLSILGEDGTQLAARALWEYSVVGGLTLYANLGFEYLDLDDIDGHSTGSALNLGVNKPLLNGLLKVGGFGTWRFTDVSIFNVDQEVHSFGGGLLTAFEKDLGTVILSGGVIYQFLRDTGDRDRNNHLLSYGLQVGVPIGQRLIVSVEVFQINNIERDNDPVVVGGSATYYFTQQWGLTLGGKTVLNLDNYDSYEGFLGTSARF